jgi:hypothetical protein
VASHLFEARCHMLPWQLNSVYDAQAMHKRQRKDSSQIGPSVAYSVCQIGPSLSYWFSVMCCTYRRTLTTPSRWAMWCCGCILPAPRSRPQARQTDRRARPAAHLNLPPPCLCRCGDFRTAKMRVASWKDPMHQPLLYVPPSAIDSWLGDRPSTIRIAVHASLPIPASTQLEQGCVVLSCSQIGTKCPILHAK